MTRRQLGSGDGTAGCACSDTSDSRRRLGAGNAEECTATSDGALFANVWFCSPHQQHTYNVTIGNDTEVVCVLEQYVAAEEEQCARGCG